MKTKVLLVALSILLSASLVLAQNGKDKGKSTQKPTSEQKKPNFPQMCFDFVDMDGDGICDHKYDGTCIGNGGLCIGFEDADGDGICDNCLNEMCTELGTFPQDGTGQQKGKKR